MKDKIISLGQYSSEGDIWQVAVVISPIGELTFIKSCLEKGLQESFLLDAVAAVDLNDAQNAFYKGEFEEEMMNG
jgi:hypothetical protein